MKLCLLPVAAAVVHDSGEQPLFLHGARAQSTLGAWQEQLVDYSKLEKPGWCTDAAGKNFESWYGEADAPACKKLCTKLDECRGVNVAGPEDCALLFLHGALPKEAPKPGWKSFDRGEATGAPVSAKLKREEDQSWSCFAKDMPAKAATPPAALKQAAPKQVAEAKISDAEEEQATFSVPRQVNFNGGLAILVLGALAVCMRCSVEPDEPDPDDASRVRSANLCRKSFSQYVPVGALLLVLFMYGRPLMADRSQQAMVLVFCWVSLLVLLLVVECSAKPADAKRPRNVAEVLTAQSTLSPPPTYVIREGYQVPQTSQMPSPPPSFTQLPATSANLRAPPTSAGTLSYLGSRGDLGAEDPVLKTRNLILARIKDRLPEDTRRNLREAFQRADVDGDGVITAEEIGTSMRTLGFTTSMDELRAMVAEVDMDGDGGVNMEEFMISTVKQLPLSAVDHLLEDAFQHFDRDPEGRMDGKVDALDIHSTMAQMLQPLTYAEAKAVVHRGASGGKDHLDLRDWKAFVMGARV